MVESRMTSRFQPFRGFHRVTSLLAICYVAVAGCQWSTSDSQPQPERSTEVTRQVVALGRLEPYDGILSIGAIPGGHLTSLQPKVQEGAVLTVPAANPTSSAERVSGEENVSGSVSGNDKDPYLLGYLDSHAIRQAQLTALLSKRSLAEKKQQSEARLADVQLLQANATHRQAQAKQAEIEAQKVRLDNLRESAELTQNQYEILFRLHQDDPELVSPHQLARQKNQSQRAMLEYETADASLGPTLEAAAATTQAASLSVEVARTNRQELQEVGEFELAAVDMEIEAARKLITQSELRLPRGSRAKGSETTQYTVLKIYMQPGEFITQLPILKVADLNHMACIAEVYEADVKQVRVGQKALLRSPAFAGNYAPRANSGKGGIPGTVRRISKIISSPGLTDRNPLAPMDRSVVEVLVEIDPGDSAATQEAGQRIGLQVTVEFQ
jgi:HlyD family secretion protein